MQPLEQILSALTPERLEQLVLEAVERRPPGERRGVGVSEIIKCLIGDHDLGTGADRSQAYLKLVEAVRTVVSSIEGFQYVESRK
jgi:hypothetical protein